MTVSFRTASLAEERRGLTLAQAAPEVRETGDGAKRFVGHAAVFDTRTAIGNPLTWGFYEEIAPGSFTKTLAEGDARMLIDHNSYYVVSRASADTLSLAQDKVGLAVDSALDTDLTYVNDLMANLNNGNITGMSFGFYVVKDDWTTETVETKDGQSVEVEVRTILEVRLVEVSAVTFPAYEETDAGLRYSLIPALRHRGDPAAIARSTRHRPDLAELLEDRATMRKAIASHSTETSDASWDAGANTKNLSAGTSASVLRSCYAWIDPDGDPKSKSSYKFPHHFVNADGAVGAASTAACTSGIAVLNGGRGGSGIPDADRQGVWNHLSRHLKDAGLEPAELKSAEDCEPVEPTRDTDAEPDITVDDGVETEPAASTRSNAPSVGDRMRTLAARYHLPRTPVG